MILLEMSGDSLTPWVNDDIIQKGYSESTKITRVFIKGEGVILHAGIQFSKIAITGLMLENITDLARRIDLVFEAFFKAMEVSDPTNMTILLGYDKHAGNLFRSFSFPTTPILINLSNSVLKTLSWVCGIV